MNMSGGHPRPPLLIFVVGFVDGVGRVVDWDLPRLASLKYLR